MPRPRMRAGISQILADLDQHISQLKQARAVLVGTPSAKEPRTATSKKKKRNLSPEGRKRIAEAARRRWAAQKKAAKKK
jgi:hypothetical protein